MKLLDSGNNEVGVSSDQLRAYLLTKQWFEDGKIRGVATIWHRSEVEHQDIEIILPFLSAKDYRKRLREAVHNVALFEKRDFADVLNEIQQLFSDVITVRVIHADTASGTIPINDGVLLISKAKELLQSAAQSIFSKRKQFSGRLPNEVTSYFDKLLLGQTEIGSYVVNVIAPAQNQVGNVEDTSVGGDFNIAQAITRNLASGLEALSVASTDFERYGEFKVFDTAIQSGASSNMCDALLGFSGEKHNRTFEITITSAASPMFGSDQKKFHFDAQHVETLQKAAEYYKDEYVLSQRTLTGHILKLSRPKDETSGTIILQSRVADVERNVQVELSGDDYHLAVLAHDNSDIVRVDGDVHIKSKRSRLLNPKRFGVMKDEDLF